MLQEFKKFILRGNVLDLAVAVIIGAAFSGIVTSLVEDIFSPILGLLGDRDFSNLYLVLKGNVAPDTPYETAKGAASVLGYGAFFTAILNFVIIATIIFFVVRAVNRLMDITARKTAEGDEAPPAPTKDQVLLTEIRDLLKDRPLGTTQASVAAVTRPGGDGTTR